MGSIIAAKDLAVGYQGKALIHDINFGICKGEIVTLIGQMVPGSLQFLKVLPDSSDWWAVRCFLMIRL